MSEDKQKNTRTFPGEKEVDGISVVRTEGRDFRVEGNDVDGYIGVSSEYRTYANETDKPIITEEEEEVLLETGTLTDVESLTVAHRGAAIREKVREQEEADAKKDDAEEDDEDDDESNESKSDDDADKKGPTGVQSVQAPSSVPTAPTTASKPVKAAATKVAGSDSGK